MPRVCTVCQHPQRAKIDAALVAGVLSFRNIAAQFGTSATALVRHKSEHVPRHLAQAKAADEVAQADSLLTQVRGLQAKAVAILNRAEEEGDLRTALAAIREARGNLELLAKLLGELDQRPQVNVILAPQWIALRTAVLRSLGTYPDALSAVTRALATAEQARQHQQGGYSRGG